MTSSMASGALQVFGDFTGTVTTDGDKLMVALMSERAPLEISMSQVTFLVMSWVFSESGISL